MQFYSGFSLKNEEYLFDKYLNRSAYCVSGFSYGAIKAFNYAKKQLASGKRVDTLQLLSPAFFQTKDTKFKRLQMLSHSKDRLQYMKHFIDSCFDPYEKKIVEFKKSTSEELDELLSYEWDLEELQKLVAKGVRIEVYLGGKDKIIDVEGARELFLEVASVTYIKEANHFLQLN
jgi:hypothetical protein